MSNEHIILGFKAGRAFRREGTNFVDPSPTKGAVYLKRNRDDDLLHFQWQDRTTNDIVEDLILFPSDATFEKVTQSSWGRTYVLKFSSSDQVHFFWMQNASDARDNEFVRHLQMMLADPERVPVWDSRVRQQPEASTSRSGSQPSAEGSLRDLTPSGSQPTEEQLAQLRALVESMSANPSGASGQPELILSDILTPATLTPLFTSHPALIPALFPHLPPDLPTPPSPEVLQRIIESPQFQSAVRSLDQALHTGLLGGLVRGLGLPEEAGTGVAPFLRAIEEQARREGGGSSGSGGGDERMDTD